MISELLGTGAENAKTGKQLAAVLGCDIRSITLQIERERRDGQPICANSIGEQPGYFLAATPEELKEYTERLKRREHELNVTRRALLSVLKKFAEEAAVGQDPGEQ